MRVLDLFCGKGGWSIPFIEDGAHVVGVDIVDLGYPGHLILEDIRNLDGHRFKGYDFIVGSPPCNEFSTAKGVTHGIRDVNKGLALIVEFNRFVKEAQPRFWAMESTRRTEKFYPIKPIWRFRMGRKAQRSLWGNLPIPLTPEFTFPNRVMASGKVTRKGYAKKRGIKAIRGPDFAMIPYPIARFIANCVKQQLVEPTAAEVA